nr:tRNA pseudouridine(55) synthase TruB [bacterium]
MTGVVNLLKPPGMTSHDAVAFLRRLTGEKRIGHAGTLDPAAAGVLVVCVGKATRLCDRLMGQNKEYIAEITLGVATDTGDQEGKIIARHEGAMPPMEDILRAMDSLTGDIVQTPPQYAAVKIGGQPAYKLAREGVAFELEARPVHVKAWTVLGRQDNRVMTRIACSKGTYVRSLAVELGNKLGCGAHVSFLLRTRSGPFALQDALTLEQAEQLFEKGRLLTTLEEVLSDLPEARVNPAFLKRLLCGNAPPPGMVRVEGRGPVRILCGDKLIALGEAGEGGVTVTAMLVEDGSITC